MEKREPCGALVSLAILALALGWIETSVVVYLREIYAQAILHETTKDLTGLQAPLLSMHGRIVPIEMMREACTMVLLGAAAWLSGRRLPARVGAFLLSFGTWNLTYYASIWLVLGRPNSLRTWDILFFFPMPWVVPVWAPVIVAAVFVVAGTYLFWTSDRDRHYRLLDISVLVASLLSTIVAFFVAWKAAADYGVPDRFPIWLFLMGVVLGIAWFVRVERHTVVTERVRKFASGMRTPTIQANH